MTFRNGAATDATVTLAARAPNAASGDRLFGRSMQDGGAGKLNVVVALTGAGSQTFGGTDPTYTGTTTVNSGTLRLWNTSLWASNATLNGGTLELQQTSVGNGFLAGAAPRTHARTIAGTGGTLSKTGDGTVILSSTNTYQGATRIQRRHAASGLDQCLRQQFGSDARQCRGSNPEPQRVQQQDRLARRRGCGGGQRDPWCCHPDHRRQQRQHLVWGYHLRRRGADEDRSGTQALTGANTYTGATTVSAGTLSVGNGGTTGLISIASPISVAGGATMAWNNNNDTTSNVTTNTLTGTGTVLFQGQNATTALQTSIYDNNGDWSGFSGEVVLNRSLLWNTTAQSQVGTGTICVQDRGTMSFNGGTFSNNIVLQSERAGTTSSTALMLW